MSFSRKNKFLFKINNILIFLLFFYGCKQTTKNKDTIKEKPNLVTETNFFTDTSNKGIYKNFVEDYGANNIDFNLDSSSKLQNAIDSISILGGGRLEIPKGNYSLAKINLKSNVHIRISDKAVIRPPKDIKGQYAIFKVTNSDSINPLENVSIVGIGGKNFTVDLRYTSNKKLRIIQSWNVRNFKYSNMLVEDDYSEFAALEFNAVKINDTIYGPRNGLVKNISVKNAHYGFGVVQLQYGSKILFKDLYGLGGATLRIETHNHTLLDASKFSISDDIYGRNIISENGNSALMLSPHFVKNGKVDVDNVTSIGSGFAVRIEKGFIGKWDAKAATKLGLTLSNGSFSPETKITNVKATFSDDKAQLKPKHFKFYMPCNLRDKISLNPNIFDGNKTYDGPSIAGAIYKANYAIQFNENNVTLLNDSIEIKERIKFIRDTISTTRDIFNCH